MDSKTTTQATYEKIAKHYEDNHKMTPENEESLKIFISLLKGHFVLDVGCADGLESNYLSNKGFKVTGIDLSPAFIRIAKNNYPNIDFKLMDMGNLAFKNEIFDGIWASASFIHIPKEKALDVIKGFHKVLNKNGILFISTKFGNLNRLWKNKYMKWGDRHFSHYTKKELESLIQCCGFEIIQTKRNYVNWGNSWLHVFAKKI